MSNDSSKDKKATVPSAEQTPVPHSGRWYALVSVTATIAAFLLAQVVSTIIVSLIPLLGHWSKTQTDNWLANSVTAQFMYDLIADVLIVASVVYLLKLLHWRPTTIGLKLPKWRHIGLGVVAAVPYFLLYVGVLIVVSLIVPSVNLNQKQQIGFNSVHGFLPLILTFMSLVVIAPLAEEIVMRGFLYSGLRKWLPKVGAALVVSGLFAAAHLQEGGGTGPLWTAGIDTFILSMVLVYLREKTGNLWAGVTLHAIKNGVAFVSLFIIYGR